jgi:hypothetical protein
MFHDSWAEPPMDLLNLPNLRWDALSDNPILKNAFQNHGTITGDDAALHLDVFVDECLDDPSHQHSFWQTRQEPPLRLSFGRVSAIRILQTTWCTLQLLQEGSSSLGSTVLPVAAIIETYLEANKTFFRGPALLRLPKRHWLPLRTLHLAQTLWLI